VNILSAYRGWKWRRLALLLPSQAAALLVNVWLAVQVESPLPIRILCVCIATILTGVIAYLIVQTLRSARFRGQPHLQEARALRRHMQPCGPVAVTSLVLLAALLLVPSLFQDRSSRPVLASFPRRSASRPAEPSRPAPETPLPEETVPQEEPAPREIAAGEPDIRPAIALEPARLQLSERDFDAPREIDLPYFPKQTELAAPIPQAQEEERLPYRPEFKEFRDYWAPTDRFRIGMFYRPLPDENDPEGWPSPEARIDGFLLLGNKDTRVPGIAFVLDLPFGRDDSLHAEWTAAHLPMPPQADGRDTTPNWNHLILAYVRRLTGYTSHASFDLAISLGISADFFRTAEGIPDPGSSPKLAPYVGADLSFWQDQAVGLLLHLGESFPFTLLGSSLGVTDLSAQVRWDLSERISIHGGYRVVLLRYKYDDIAATPGTSTLRDSLTGPILGLDIRF
jgi:hypothetical protein